MKIADNMTPVNSAAVTSVGAFEFNSQNHSMSVRISARALTVFFDKDHIAKFSVSE